jgi:membrane fusion protein (multidrug efflux system)
MSQTANSAEQYTSLVRSNRTALMALVIGVMLALGAAWGLYWMSALRGFESTDNAYVQAPVVQITPQAAGTVIAVLADDTDVVTSGQPLVRLDPADAQLALSRAEAQLGQTVREVSTLFANNAALAASVSLRVSDEARLQVELSRARDDLARRAPLAASGAIGTEDLKHAEAAVESARNALAVARAALQVARDQAASNLALTQGTSVQAHPSVERAATAYREAWLALQRCEIPAPLTGQVARRTVQVGQRIAAGAPLMSIVPLEQVWVEANFKEGQLRQMRIGQPVRLQADVYGRKVEFDGKVRGLGAGTGAAFALLPAQNATGNWIKVVQRVPVRIEIDPAQLEKHPLRVGLSMQVEVDVSKADGTPLAMVVVPERSNSTGVFVVSGAKADERIRQIIASNLALPGAGASVQAVRHSEASRSGRRGS